LEGFARADLVQQPLQDAVGKAMAKVNPKTVDVNGVRVGNKVAARPPARVHRDRPRTPPARPTRAIKILSASMPAS
jgi:hypothetical protein